ncbi:hypothetical protein J2Z40_003266 [Cytobacillus eiseniae]|uniref:DUF2802 domain-containing protein n=1 Tax=Cytobacillus eiseniae TaxID=762947 RepID=A0ABS4RIG7_9BACI|nr:hypothetical protein [Cytobacillus eiseniae]MBP2242686.1 hypothetical protein [Cytobacillus eiseniae]
MGWMLGILFGIAIVLLVLSFLQTKQSTNKLEQHIDQVSFSLMNEVNELQQQIRNVEFDTEIIVHEAGILAEDPEQRMLLKDMLDLHKRGYSLDSIAAEKQLTIDEVENFLFPYINKGRKESN